MYYFVLRLKYYIEIKLKYLTFPIFFYFFLRFKLSTKIIRFYLYSVVPKRNFLKSKKNILFLEKGVFNDEVKEVFSDEKFRLLQLNRKFTKSLSNFCFQTKVNQHNFKKVRENKTQLKSFRNYLDKAFEGIKVNLFITFNFGSEEDEVIIHLKKLKIPSICMHKEGLMTEGEYKDYIKILSNRIKFPGEKILLYNQKIKEILIKYQKHNRENLIICGSPRFDKILKSESDKKKKNIIMFMPGLYKSLPSQLGIKSEMSWKLLCQDFVNLVKILSDEFHDYQFIIKSKKRDFDIMKNILLEINKKNIIIDTKSLAADLLLNAKFSIGFNSMALIESICFRVPAINCMFGEAKKKEYKKYIHNYESLIKNVYSIVEAVEYLKKNLDIQLNKNISPKNKKILDKLIGNSRGDSIIRIRREIDKII